jgi:MFS family permease
MQVVQVLRQVFASPDIRRVQGGWLLAITAEWIYLVNLLVLAYLVGGIVGVGIVGMLRTLPAAFLGPMLATVADRFPRHRVLLAVHLSRGLLILAVALAALAELPAVLVFGAVLLEGIVATLHRASTFAIMPALARSPQELVASNVSISLSEGFGVLSGPAVGGLLVASVGAPVGLIAGAIGFGLAGLAVTGIRPTHRAHLPEPSPRGRVLRELLAGFGTLREYPHVGLLVGVLASQTFVRGILTVLIVAVAVELLVIGEAGVGYLNSALGAGGLIGGIVGLALVTRRSLTMPLLIGLSLWGLPIAVMGLVPVTLLAIIAMGVIGVANAVLDIAAFTLLQRTAPNRVRGRVLGALEGLVALSIGLGSLVAPVLVIVLGLQGALVVTGLLLPVVAVATGRFVKQAEDRAVVPDRQLGLLRGVTMLAPLPMTVIEQLASAAEFHRVAEGANVVTQGERGETFYIIAQGSADVVHDGELVTQLRVGDAFGEIALLRDVPRTATVRAASDLEVLRLGRRAFVGAVCGSSQSLDAADAMVGTRLQALDHG